MTKAIHSLIDIADQFDAIVLDQWGVLHDGTRPYPNAIQTLRSLKQRGVRLAVLSNSGKRSAPNAHRIADMGFNSDLFETVMTSGEALWRDIAHGRVPQKTFYAIVRDDGDAQNWADGLDITFTHDIAQADAVLLMGLPDAGETDSYRSTLAAVANTPVFCTNPDRASPRADGVVVTSPGALAHECADAGGDVRFYGKPHSAVFDAIETALDLPKERLLMVGDSLEHDIQGAATAGWSSLFVRGGLHAQAFAQTTDMLATVAQLAQQDRTALPTFTLAHLE